jgi:hypothetical protein
MDIPDISMISTAEESSVSLRDDDTSFQLDQPEESFDDDSFEEMSFISHSEIQDLEADAKDFEDDGYDTETTDNTTSSHKSSQPTTRKSSRRARERISELLIPSDAQQGHLWASNSPTKKSSQPDGHSHTFPHPSHDTNKRGGHGAEMG